MWWDKKHFPIQYNLKKIGAYFGVAIVLFFLSLVKDFFQLY